MKDVRRKLKDQAGFNLIELMIVIAIIALLVAVGIPA
ncbi:MAG: prepilin-type N-terminal cleavage/methylation domain-containing protein [Acidobacteria bacterium]|nr:prepilin-type N-terminal cleavage/methylation domain-containing protein [Acidobacteriota bacterium]